MADQTMGADPEKNTKNERKGLDKEEDVLDIITAKFLVPVPISIALLGELHLVCSSRDTSLRDICPVGGFKYLKNPDSLKVCLLQITDKATDAFDSAYTNMQEILLSKHKIDMHINDIVRSLLGSAANEMQHILSLALFNISDIADTYKALASETEQKFNDVMHLLKEVLLACTALKGHYDERYKEIEAAIRIAKEQKILYEDSEKKLVTSYQEKERQLTSAKEKLDSAIKEMPSTLKLVGVHSFDQTTCSVRDVARTMSSGSGIQSILMMITNFTFACKNVKEFVDSFMSKQVSPGDQMRIIYKLKSLQELFEEHRPNIDRVKEGRASEILRQLQREKKNDDALGGCIKKADGICKDLIDYANHADHDTELATCNKIMKIHDELQNEVQTIEARMNTESTSFKRTCTFSLAGHISAEALLKVEMAKQNLVNASRKHEEANAELREESKILRQTSTDLQAQDLAKTKFDEIRDILSKGIDALTAVKQQWGDLCVCLKLISTLIKCRLHASITCFVNYSTAGKDLILKGERVPTILKQCTIKQITEANRILYVVQSICSTFVEISEKYKGDASLEIVPPRDTDITLRRSMLQKEMEKAQIFISNILEEKQRECNEHIAKRVKTIKTDIEANQPLRTEERVK